MALIGWIRKNPDRTRTYASAALLGAMGVLLVAWVATVPDRYPRSWRDSLVLFGWKLNDEPFTRKVMHGLFEDAQWWAAIALVVLALFRFVPALKAFKHREVVRSLAFVVALGVAGFTSLVAVMQFGAHRGEYFDIGDTYHYFLGPKYFKELAYNDLYLASVMAREEAGEALPPRVRDLRTNDRERTARLLHEDRRARIRGRFTDERWAAFRHDVDLYRKWHSTPRWHHRLQDHGYNGSPPLAFLGAALSNAVEVSPASLNGFSALNVAVTFAALLLLVLTLGWELGLFVVILFWVNICDRFLLGGAFLRYVWIAFLLSGLGLLARRRYAAAGACIASAASLQVFPILFLGGMALRSLYGLVRTRRFPRRYRRFAAGALIAFALWGVGSISHARGIGNWTAFLDQMKVEARYADGRIGFVYNFLHPKSHALTDPHPNFAKQLKDYEAPRWGPLSLQHVRKALTLLFVVLLLMILRRATDYEATVLVGAGLFFFLFSTVRYYYAGWAMVPLLWWPRRHRWEAAVMLLAVFAVSIRIYQIHDDVTHSYVHNTVLSWFYTAYLVAVLPLLAFVRFKGRSWPPRRGSTFFGDAYTRVKNLLAPSMTSPSAP